MFMYSCVIVLLLLSCVCCCCCMLRRWQPLPGCVHLTPPVDSHRRAAHTLDAPAPPPAPVHTTTMHWVHSAHSWRRPHHVELRSIALLYSKSALAPTAGAPATGELTAHRCRPEVPQRGRPGHGVRHDGVPVVARVPVIPNPVFSVQMVQRWTRTRRSSDPLHLATSFLRSSARRG